MLVAVSYTKKKSPQAPLIVLICLLHWPIFFSFFQKIDLRSQNEESHCQTIIDKPKLKELDIIRTLDEDTPEEQLSDHTYSSQSVFKDCQTFKPESLNAHTSKLIGKNIYKCVECNFMHREKVQVKTHFLQHTNIKPFKCPYCNYAAKVKRNLKGHMWLHTGKQPYKCFKCNYATHHRQYLTNHMLVHLDINLYKCADCDFSTKRRNCLKRHVLIHQKDTRS